MSHPHHHGHAHAHAEYGKRFALAAIFNALFIIVEAGFGFYADSLALIADAAHNVSDVLGLVVAWVAYTLCQRKPDARYTYGFRGSSIVAALFNALLLLLLTGAMAWEAVQRLLEPVTVQSGIVAWVAGLGVLVNALSARLVTGHKHELNARAAYLHLAGDAAASAGVAAAGIVMARTGWMWLDPLVSLLLCAIIIAAAWGVLREAVMLTLAAVPPGVDGVAVKAYLAALPGVAELHDLHIWGMSTTEVALSAHLVVPCGHPGDVFLEEISAVLRQRFGITHATVQIELGDGTQACMLAPEHVV